MNKGSQTGFNGFVSNGASCVPIYPQFSKKQTYQNKSTVFHMGRYVEVAVARQADYIGPSCEAGLAGIPLSREVSQDPGRGQKFRQITQLGCIAARPTSLPMGLRLSHAESASSRTSRKGSGCLLSQKMTALHPEKVTTSSPTSFRPYPSRGAVRSKVVNHSPIVRILATHRANRLTKEV